MEWWIDLPWGVRMTASLIVLGLGGVLMYLAATGQIEFGYRRRNSLMLPGLMILGGVIMFVTSFPQDGGSSGRGKYNF